MATNAVSTCLPCLRVTSDQRSQIELPGKQGKGPSAMTLLSPIGFPIRNSRVRAEGWSYAKSLLEIIFFSVKYSISASLDCTSYTSAFASGAVVIS